MKIAYKPGWTLRFDGDRLEVKVAGVDSRSGGHYYATYERTVPGDLDEFGGFGNWLLNFLDGLEHHETREWLRINGELVHDSHFGRGGRDGD